MELKIRFFFNNSNFFLLFLSKFISYALLILLFLYRPYSWPYAIKAACSIAERACPRNIMFAKWCLRNLLRRSSNHGWGWGRTLSQLQLGLKTNNVHPSSNYRGKLMCIALFWYPTRIPKWAHNSTTYYMKILHSQDFIRKTWYMQRESMDQDHIHVMRPCHLQIKAGPLGTVKKSRLSPRSHAHRDDQS